jgi:23S rRNA U2552 (ribose-2'-O)-methylase RlmE/FtsJ
MFSESDSYERFMGRWSRRLAPLFVAFAGVTKSDRVLDVGSAPARWRPRPQPSNRCR